MKFRGWEFRQDEVFLEYDPASEACSTTFVLPGGGLICFHNAFLFHASGSRQK
jgi:hypothetical protein